MWVLAGIVFGSLLAFLRPGAVLWMQPGLQPAFAVTMLLVGTLIRREQLRAFIAAPGRAGAGIAAQYTIMPLVAWAVSLALADPAVRTGLVLVGCMPGAMASNVMTLLFRGDLVLSVTMTTVATLICPLTISLWLPILADARVDVPVAAVAWNATWMVALPVLIGIALRRSLTEVPRWWESGATAVAAAAIVMIVLVVVAANRERLVALGPAVASAVLLLNLSGYTLAFVVATLLGWPPVQRRTLVIEVGMQNAGLGTVLALGHLGQAAAVPSAFYTVLCVVTAAAALPFSRSLLP